MSVSEAQFEGWIVEHYPAIYRRCYYLLGDPVEAEDAAQETFLRAFQARERYDPAQPVLPWLHTIATRHCLDRLRRRQRRRSNQVPWDDGRRSSRAPVKADDPERRLLAAEEAQAVRAAVAALPPVERTLVVLHYWEGLSYDAIAAQTGLSPGAIKSRLYRARQRLAHMLETTTA